MAITLTQLARILDAGWNAPKLERTTPAGDAVAIALDAMAREAERMASESDE